MYSIGIDVGYSAVKVSLIDFSNGKADVLYSKYAMHKGRVKEALKEILNEVLEKFDGEKIEFGLVTGSGKDLLTTTGVESLNEVTAVLEGCLFLAPDAKSIVEIGGQGAKYITGFSKNFKNNLEISMNSSCSAGTGSFIEEQVLRLGIKLDEYSEYASRASTIPRIAGRCSVFAKTDIIHHQQEGVSIPDILKGLAYALVRNYKAAVIKKLPIKKPVAFLGGVAFNRAVVDALKDVLQFDDRELIIPENFQNALAIGAAVFAKEQGIKIAINSLMEAVKKEDNYVGIILPVLSPYGNGDSIDKHKCVNMGKDEKIKAYMGVDIGSTSTNVVLINEDGDVIFYNYIRTRGNPVKALKTCFEEVLKKFGNLKLLGVGVTGSGRYMIGKMIGADVIIDEITAQAKAAVNIEPDVDTIFEIGGQDSKYISIKDGRVVDFTMNKICAAGTGSFLEEQAKKLGIDIEKFGDIALNSKNPVYLGDRCTVFIEASVADKLSKGVKHEDIAAGLCHSIVKNYLNKVVGSKRIGKRILLQGGIAYNQGVVNAFRANLGDSSQSFLSVPQFFSVTGSIGAGLLAKERKEKDAYDTKFKGFDILSASSDVHKTDLTAAATTSENTDGFNILEKIEKLYLKNYDGTIDPSKETIGIPRVLFMHRLFPLFNAFFKQLGFNVLLSDRTDNEIVELSQKQALAETCFPMKLVIGHVLKLIEKDVDYIFLPSLYTMKHPGSKVREDYACVYMQKTADIVKRTVNLEKEGIRLISPLLSFKFGKKYMMKSLFSLGAKLGKGKIKTAIAIQKGMSAFNAFNEEIKKLGVDILESTDLNEKVFVIITRPYGVYDPVLNMGIPDKLAAMGHKVITLSSILVCENDVSREYPNMFWPFGQHILAGIQIAKQHPNIYPIYFTNHGCGPDAALIHYVKHEMGDKPYLHIEVDEHASDVGVITRIEAFINSLSSISERTAKKDFKEYCKEIRHYDVNIIDSIFDMDKDRTLYLPDVYPYADILKEILLSKGIKAEKLCVNEKALELGRKHTITKEYFSFTALLGSVLYQADRSTKNNEKISFFIPKSEGSEKNAQYDRLVWTKLYENGYDMPIISPFVEDLILDEYSSLICDGVLAGDIIMTLGRESRGFYLQKVISSIKNNDFNFRFLQDLAEEIYNEKLSNLKRKKIFAIGEAAVLYNGFMNGYVLDRIENSGYEVLYAPLAEMLWLMWEDFMNKIANKTKKEEFTKRLEKFKDSIQALSVIFANFSPFENDLLKLKKQADDVIGYYAGGFGRYRAAKPILISGRVDGIINISSMYENTSIVLDVLYQGSLKERIKPILNLSFDGNFNKSDEMKVHSFLHYI